MFRTFTCVLLFIYIFSPLCLSSSTARRDKRSIENGEVNASNELSPRLQMMIQRGASLEAFLSSVTKDGQPMTIQDVYPFESIDNTTGEKAYISGGSRIALPDECSPRLMSVPIPRIPGDSADVVYWPECTRIERCGGCCPSDKLACVPERTEEAQYHVLRASVNDQESLYLEWAGPLAVLITRHLTCRVVCKLNPLDCEPYQKFIPEECTCVCNYRMECRPSQVWDPDLCECRCKRSSMTVCNRNTVFDYHQCRCVISTEAQEANIAINADLSQSEIDEYLQIQNQSVPVTTPTTPPTTTTSTTTTTTTPAPTTPQDPCRDIRCPPRWFKVVRNNGCVCRPFRG